jgi:hypothetical protein
MTIKLGNLAATPAAPSTGLLSLYAEDNALKIMDATGVETILAGPGSYIGNLFYVESYRVVGDTDTSLINRVLDEAGILAGLTNSQYTVLLEPGRVYTVTPRGPYDTCLWMRYSNVTLDGNGATVQVLGNTHVPIQISSIEDPVLKASFSRPRSGLPMSKYAT